MPRPFDSLVIEEKGFRVELSNCGMKKKNDYCRFRNSNGKKVRCAVEGCEETTRARCGVCGDHKDKFGWLQHKVDWISRIIPPSGTREEYITNTPSFSNLAESLCQWAMGNQNKIARLTAFHTECLNTIAGKIPDSTSLQEIHEGKAGVGMGPESIIDICKGLIDKYFPSEKFAEETSKNANIVKIPCDSIPHRLTATLLLLGYFCEESNRGDLWYKERAGEKDKAMFAGCYLSAGHFLYRMYTNASQQQIRICLRG
jgi:hypothetical protein